MDPITPLMNYGMTVGGVILCTGLFIWNTLEIQGQKRSIEDNTLKITEVISKIIDGQKLAAEAVSRLIEDNQKFTTKMLGNQNILATNLINLTTTVNEVVKELIGVIREVEKD